MVTGNGEDDQATLEKRTMRKLTRRLVPYLIAAYFIAYIDRTNLSFAALQMNPAIGLSATAFGFGAGVFFLTYFVFEVPSNLVMAKVGARRWIARIMVTWGIVSGCMALVSGEISFYVVRALLGVAEAGFFPGVLFYLTLWFPAAYRSRIVSLFMVSVPLSVVIGAPISGLVLKIDLWGLAGWQWLFVIEALPAVVLGVVTWFFLTDRPGDARWLADDERTWLTSTLEREAAQATEGREVHWLRALANRKILALVVVDIAICAINTGIGIFLPQIIQGFGVGSTLVVTLLTALPYLVAAVGMVWWGRRSDRKGERRMHTAIPLGLSTLGIVALVFLPDSTSKMVGITAIMLGLYSMQPVFWTLPAMFLSGTAVASAFAGINSVGNLAGFVGPFAVGWLKDSTGSYNPGLLLIAACGVLGVLAVLIVARGRAASTLVAGSEREPTMPVT
ncbi:MFS transporter [Pseudonocardia sp. GCM10023141]|uniref:MFS transporter n=1 Tax=Pseudonocardia sp. GCM10023141 TaxID=3252653 RepID=UPI00361A7254